MIYNHETHNHLQAHTDNETYAEDIVDLDTINESLEKLERQHRSTEVIRDERLSVQHAMVSSMDLSKERLKHCLKRGKGDQEQMAQYGKLRSDGKAWKHQYRLAVIEYQKRVQNHIHPIDTNSSENKPKIPLYCQRSDNRTVCKARYPRNAEMGDACLGCKRLCKEMNLPVSGKRCMLGALLGPRNHPMLNGTHPALLYNLKTNSDTMITYRVPITELSHSVRCKNKTECLLETSMKEVLTGALRSQRDQAGYITDYVSKRTPIVISEIKKFNQGHHTLLSKLQSSNESTQYHARRQTQRMLTNLHGSVVRMSVEVTNLQVMRRMNDVTAAESMKSNNTVAFKGSHFVASEKRAHGKAVYGKVHTRMQKDDRNPYRVRIAPTEQHADKYGYRGNHEDVLYLSPYEFVSAWEIMATKIPIKCSDHERHCHVTLHGNAKAKAEAGNELQPGVDYVIRKEHGTTDGRKWIAFPESTGNLRHDYVMVKRYGQP